MKILTRIALGGTCLVASTIAWPAGQSSTNFAIPLDTLNIGVADMSSANFQLASSIGDSVATGTVASNCFQLSGGFRAQVNVLPSALRLLSVMSRKIHNATPHELTIDPIHALPCQVTVEPRLIGSGHTLVFRFDNPVLSVAGATARDAVMNIIGNAIPSTSGNDVIVHLSNIGDGKRLTLTLTGLNGSEAASVSMGFLAGDVTNSRAVTAADISAVKAHMGGPVNMNTFKFDLNATGDIGPSDLSVVKARSGSVLP